MATSKIEKELLHNIKGLPKEALKEIIEFIQLVRNKRMKNLSDNLTDELSALNTDQEKHLEKEFKDYKQLYPSE